MAHSCPWESVATWGDGVGSPERKDGQLNKDWKVTQVPRLWVFSFRGAEFAQSEVSWVLV